MGGYWSIIYSKISNLVIIAFTISFSVLLVGFVDWESVISCGNHDQCKNVQLIKNNIVQNRAFGSIVVIYTMVFVVYFLWHFANFVYSLSSLKETERFYHLKLELNDDKIRRTPWREVMDKIVCLQSSVRLHHNKYLDALDITNRIMRKENYMIAFVNRGVLQFTTPSFSDKLCWTFRGENRRNTNADVLRTDPAALAKSAAKPDRKKMITDKLRMKSYFHSERRDSPHCSTNRQLLATSSDHIDSGKVERKRLKAIKSKIQKTLAEQKEKLNLRDKHRGYHHVGIVEDNGDGTISDDDSDVSDASDVMSNGIGHEYPQGKMGNIANSDRVFFDDFVVKKFNADHTEDTLDRMDRMETSGGYLGNILEWLVCSILSVST